MKKMLRNLKTGILITTLATVAACTAKNRDVSYQQGQGKDLENISDFDGKTFELQTLDVMAQTSDIQNVQAKTTNVAAEKENIQRLPLVKYKTDAKLLGDVPFRGRPNHKYTIQYRVTEKYLKIFKIAPAKDIDLHEQTYAETQPDGRLAVALVGYPVKGFYNTQRVKNSDNEDTNKLGEYSVPRDQASQFKVDYNGRQIFEALEKENVLPASYFKGEWFYSATLIAAPEEKKDTIGFDMGHDQSMNPASRIRFSLNESLLKVLNINVDERLDKSDDINLSTALAIPIQWKEFEAKKEGKDKGLSEAEIKDKSWEKKKFIEMDLDAVVGASDFGSAATAFKGAKLVDLEVNDTYFAFVVHQHDSNTRMRYSFMRAENRNYKGKIHFDEDFEKFGFFTTRKAVANNFEIRRKEDRQKNVFISRFNPKKDIVFYFTRSTPQWLRPAAKEAALSWNDAFQKAGLNIRVVLDETRDAELGDIRYNTINLIESLSEGSLFGFGPSVTDSYTGEIISATSNVHITPIRSALVDEIRNYIRMKMGELQGSYVTGLAAIATDFFNTEIKQTTEADGSVTIAIESDSARPEVQFEGRVNGEVKNIRFKEVAARAGREKDLAITSKNIHVEIQRQCPEVEALISDRKSSGQIDSAQELLVLDECSKKLVLHKMSGTLIHEMGHNFGLRHNFMGSNDVSNFWSKEESKTTEVVRSSSVMEYPAFNEDRLTKPGQYDIAALRYGYGDAVELKDGSVKSLDVSKKIADQVQNIRKFKFCTDHHVSLSIDPMCQRHDSGTTPLEVVNSIILQYNTSVALLNHRYDSIDSIDPARLGAYRNRTIFGPLKRFYEEWRNNVARFVGPNKKYIEGMSKEQYQEVLSKMATDPVYGPIYAQYKPVADKVFDFLRTVALIPNRYCVAKNTEEKIELFELDVIREQIYFSTGNSAMSCNDAAVKNLLKANFNVEVQTEYGYFLNDVRFDQSPEKVTEKLDIIGMEYDRLYAGLSLGNRTSYGVMAASKGFAPSFMDEPQYRESWLATLESRILAGLDIRSIAAALKIAPENFSESFLQRFKQESHVMKSQLQSAMIGLRVPGDNVESSVRQTRYSSTFTSNPQMAQQGNDAINIDGINNFVVFDEDATFAKNLIYKLREIRRVRSFDAINTQELEAIGKLVSEMFGNETVTSGLKVDLLAQLPQKLIALKLTASSSGAIITGALETEIGLANFINANLAKATPEVKAFTLNQDLAEFYKNFTKEDFTLTGKTFAARVQVVQDQLALEKAHYDRNKVDKDSQMTLIGETMRLISR